MGIPRISGIAKALDTKGIGHGYYDADFYKYPAKREVHPIVGELNYIKKEVIERIHWDVWPVSTECWLGRGVDIDGVEKLFFSDIPEERMLWSYRIRWENGNMASKMGTY